MHELSFLNWKENRLFTPSTRPVGSDLSSIPSHSSHQCPQTMSALSISSKILMGCHPVHSVFPACILRTRTHLALCLLCCQGFVRRTFPNIYIAPKGNSGEGNGTPLQYCCLENPMDEGAWWAAVHAVTKSDMTERLHLSLSCIGEGNGNSLQCSCLENPRDRGVWWAAIYGVTQSGTGLKRFSSRSSKGNSVTI